MRDILKLAPKPARYAGAEWGAVVKDPQRVEAHIALAFPDLYEVGMSYLGQRILYEAVNRVPYFFAERVFAPCEEAAAVMREKGATLCALETGAPLAGLDALAFHLTHELCYSTVLYMLELAGLPLRAADRDERHPLVMAGGGCAFNPEPAALFFDLIVLGDGEVVLPRILEILRQAKKDGLSRHDLLRALCRVPGVYVPAFFTPQEDGSVQPVYSDYDHVEKAIVPDLDAVPFPTNQVVPFGQAVHDRLTVEIARGCTRGCRFCHAGMVYRPVRERGLKTLGGLIDEGLCKTGFEELSFLSLSTGDFSTLESLFSQSIARCVEEQVSISLPSLRAGSLSENILAQMASLRRTGATVAPEAASQRLRDVINKGISEEDILDHVRRLFGKGWQGVKLYFMIGLPTETMEDVQAIFELTKKVMYEAGPKAKRLLVTGAVSPFVPKPHTPFQWERQLSMDEVKERISLLRGLFDTSRKLKMRWHEPAMSWLEGVFSRGGRELAPVVEAAMRKGAVFTGWVDRFDLTPWLEALAECGIDGDAYLRARDIDAPLPWDHLYTGVSKQFLLKERERAFAGTITPDCRYGECSACGVCNDGGKKTRLRAQADLEIRPRVNASAPERGGELPEILSGGAPREDVTKKGGHYRIWFSKKGTAALLSQLELLSVYSRAFRRAGLRTAFSAGYHPQPLLSFGWALPVGVESECEWFAVFLRDSLSCQEVAARLGPALPAGLAVTGVEPLGPGKKVLQPVAEEFVLRFTGDGQAVERGLAAWRDFLAAPVFPFFQMTKKGGKSVDLRPFVTASSEDGDGAVRLTCDWKDRYMNPLKLAAAACGDLPLTAFSLTKTRQIFPVSPAAS